MNPAIKNLQFHDIYSSAKTENPANLIVQQNAENGFGEMDCYDIAPGIKITYNNLNMDSCYRTMIPQQDFLQIDHCLEGCYECEMTGGSVSFLGEGDLSVSSLCKGQQLFKGQISAITKALILNLRMFIFPTIKSLS